MALYRMMEILTIETVAKNPWRQIIKFTFYTHKFTRLSANQIKYSSKSHHGYEMGNKMWLDVEIKWRIIERILWTFG